jgi:hypothetical protein
MRRWSLLALSAGLPLLSACGPGRCEPLCASGFLCVEDAQHEARCADPATLCGGIAGTRCPPSYTGCVDDPRDDCDPARGGADCIGLCVR